MAELLDVFSHAALPQKIVLALLVASALWAMIAGALELRGSQAGRRGLLLKTGLAAPAAGLLVGAMNAFHMMDTTLRLPGSPSAKDLAPGVMEVATLVGLGALAGLLAIGFVALSGRAGAEPRL